MKMTNRLEPRNPTEALDVQRKAEPMWSAQLTRRMFT